MIGQRTMISIHALHEESDLLSDAHLKSPKNISIHALHEESDFKDGGHYFLVLFQSTLSMRRATKAWQEGYAAG